MINDNAPAAAAAKEDYVFLIENDYFLLCFSPWILTVHFSPHFILLLLLYL